MKERKIFIYLYSDVGNSCIVDFEILVWSCSFLNLRFNLFNMEALTTFLIIIKREATILSFSIGYHYSNTHKTVEYESKYLVKFWKWNKIAKYGGAKDNFHKLYNLASLPCSRILCYTVQFTSCFSHIFHKLYIT